MTLMELMSWLHSSISLWSSISGGNCWKESFPSSWRRKANDLLAQNLHFRWRSFLGLPRHIVIDRSTVVSCIGWLDQYSSPCSSSPSSLGGWSVGHGLRVYANSNGELVYVFGLFLYLEWRYVASLLGTIRSFLLLFMVNPRQLSQSIRVCRFVANERQYQMALLIVCEKNVLSHSNSLYRPSPSLYPIHLIFFPYLNTHVLNPVWYPSLWETPKKRMKNKTNPWFTIRASPKLLPSPAPSRPPPSVGVILCWSGTGSDGSDRFLAVSHPYRLPLFISVSSVVGDASFFSRSVVVSLLSSGRKGE